MLAFAGSFGRIGSHQLATNRIVGQRRHSQFPPSPPPTTAGHPCLGGQVRAMATARHENGAPASASSGEWTAKGAIVWFRNDLRLHDNVCLAAAAKGVQAGRHATVRLP
mmetsp:Transcript_26191/g.73418  ORF Transcript_26191/g.73418 Transcript_26191/m.73418 type:complete len:109 (-) Transcript_26191:82-408(-)